MNRDRRTVGAALAVSLALHLVLFSVRLAEKDPEVRRFHVRKLPDLFWTPRFQAGDPDLPDPLMDKLASPSPSPPRTRLDHSPSILPIPRIYLPESLGEPAGTGARPEEFVAGDLDLPTLEELEMAAALRKGRWERYERFAYLPLALIDSTTASQRMARRIVMRAVEAMGGVAALARITRLQKRVWVEAHEHVAGRRTIPKKMFLYPVETWRASGFDSLEKRPVPIEVSFDLDRPNAEYQVYNPARTLEEYGRLVASVWHSWPLLPEEAMRLRRRGRENRWHFLDRYLGEGIGLEYLGREQLQRDRGRNVTGRARVDVVEVRDYEFGTYLRASFDVETGLLIATREGLNPAEEDWYRPRFPGEPPAWTTEYGDYRPVQDVLMPHRMEAYDDWPLSVVLRLEIAANDDTLRSLP